MRFLFFMSLFGTVMFLMHALVYASVVRVFEVVVPYWYVWIAVLSLSYILAARGVRTWNNRYVDWFYFAAATWLGIVFLTFSIILPYELLHHVIGFDSQTVLGGLLLLSLVLSAFGIFQGRCLMTRSYTIPVSGLTESIKLVHLSDIHVGTVHQEKFLNRIVKQTNELKPDMVLVTGDLFDGSAPIQEEMLRPLDTLNAPSYFSTGNHEEYEGLVLVQETIADLDMRLLDNKMETSHGIQIIGVNDKQSLKKDQSLTSILGGIQYDASKPTVLMYHTPVEWSDARREGIDLMLSGHTHNGQIYPFNLLVKLFFKYVNGLYKKDDRFLHVSPGTGTWGPPMRLGSRNQITFIELTPM